MSGAHGHGHVEGDNKKIALLIAVLAVFLAGAETMAKSAQTNALRHTIDASNLWSFFQAKTIRQTVVNTARETSALDRARNGDPSIAAAVAEQTDQWKKTVARWESEPDTAEGRRELVARAKAEETKRDTAFARYHHYEVSSVAFQIAIVMASATVITGATALLWISAGLGVAGIVFAGIGLLAPHAVHLF